MDEGSTGTSTPFIERHHELQLPDERKRGGVSLDVVKAAPWESEIKIGSFNFEKKISVLPCW
jgi:hypothetical protein